MRPTGVVLIALYHFLGAFFLLLLAITLLLGGSVLGAMFGGIRHSFIGGLGLLAGVVGGVFFFSYAIAAAAAAVGLWSLREWARILSIVLAVISLLFSLPACWWDYPSICSSEAIGSSASLSAFRLSGI